MKYNIGEKYWAPYTRGYQCYGEIINYTEDGRYVMYNKRHGRYIVTEEQIDVHN